VRPGGFGEPADGNASAENWDGSTPSRDKAIDVLAPFEEQVAACRAELVAELQASEPTSERRSMDGLLRRQNRPQALHRHKVGRTDG
jgi:hypothetical protein